MITEGLYTDDAYAQGYLFQPGLADDAQREAWRPVVARVQAAGGRIVAQLMHAGALSQGNPHRSGSKGPSAVQPKGLQMSFYRGEGAYRLPEVLSLAEIDEVVAGFASAAVRAREAGFDGVEIRDATSQWKSSSRWWRAPMTRTSSGVRMSKRRTYPVEPNGTMSSRNVERWPTLR